MRSPRDTVEVVGIAAVVVGLLFVGYELRQNQLGLQAQVRATLSQIDIESIRSVREDEPMLSAVAKHYNVTVEQMRFALYIREQARTAEHQFYQYRVGAMELKEFSGVRDMWRSIFSSDRHRSWWDMFKGDFSPAFQREFDQLLDEEKHDA